MMKQLVLWAIALAFLVSCPVQIAAEAKAPEVPVGALVVVTGDGEQGAEMIEVKAGQYIKVSLFAAGGTGYSWTLAEPNLALIEPVGDQIEPVDPDSRRVGGRMKWSYYLKVKESASGQEVLKFVLRRPWEKNTPPARSFELTVVTK